MSDNTEKKEGWNFFGVGGFYEYLQANIKDKNIIENILKKDREFEKKKEEDDKKEDE